MAIMRWNVRVVRVEASGEERFEFHEVEQDEGKAPHAIHREQFDTDGKDVKELYDRLRHMLGAINQPVLNMGDYPDR